MKLRQYLTEINMKTIDSMPEFEPLPMVVKIQKKYKLSPVWKEYNDKRATHSKTINGRYILINSKHRNDLRTQLHELGHYVMDMGYVDKQGIKRLFQFYKKSLPKWGKDQGVKSYGFHEIDGQAFNMNNPDEFFAEMFQLYIQNFLKGDNKKVMDMLMTGKKF